MDIVEFIPIVNEMKRNKASKLTIDNTAFEQVGMTYKNWRKKVNELGYTCINNQFIKVVDNNNNEEVKSMTNYNIEQIEPVKRVTNTIVNPIISDSKSNKEIELMKNEIQELKQMVLEQQDIISKSKMKSEKIDIVQKSFRVSESILKEFQKVCKSNKVKQVNALNKALEMYIEQFKKY